MIRRTFFLRTLAACVLAAPLSQAQVLLPLDSRPATSTLPAAIAGLVSPDVRLAPQWLLGDAKQGADAAALHAWLAAQTVRADLPLIVSLDALAYGGLVQSRTSPVSAEEALSRLDILKARAAQGQPIYAFITLPRSPDATDRARNLAVVRAMLGWAAEGVFKELHVTWDDALPGSPAPQEGAELAKTAPGNVLIYPGADEVLSSLVARALAPQPASLRAEYSDPGKADALMKYEGIPLSRSVALHARAAGFTLPPSGDPAAARPAPLTLYVYNGGDTRKAALRISALLRSGPVAVADVNAVNQGNSKLWADLSTLRRPANLAALAAWGTPGNNIGSALAHAKIWLSGADPIKQDALLAHEYANDVLYSALLRPAVRKALPEAELGTPQASAVIEKLAQPDFPLRLGQRYTLDSASFPWGRSFEWQFDLKPLP
ncbi:hypothetical protein DKM44_00315 [Deinococcus irradiatisoli]|uniref:DUF4127 domain-containing protein n=1 Tax=Deinococcus irradiatisoli TaxID=2202254 RepID=A0A2Z3JG45_9DEIO|nr:DUF4127 family protein [Deinococcus irradiatisoli]AWN21869.1 hypothetical protein DKM44_00315 [Deinococcus irradiatisoli]